MKSRPTNPLLVNEDIVLKQYTGRYDSESNYALMASRATTLLRDAFNLISDMEHLTGFGETNLEYRNWLERVSNFAEQKNNFMVNGKDFE